LTDPASSAEDRAAGREAVRANTERGSPMAPYNRSDKEEEYFLKKEAEKLKALAEKARKETEESERKRLKELHYMRCPKCGMELQEIEFREVKIDKCASCGGVWLDDGELEQIAEGEPEDGLLRRFSGIFKSGK
jgi:hypothetical protein